MAKKASSAMESSGEFSYEDMIKALKSIKGSQSFIGEDEIKHSCTIDRVQTDFATVDFLASGGISEGRVTILAGDTGSGKSTLSFGVVGALQRKFKASGNPKMTLIYDIEGNYDANWAETQGVDNKYVIVKRTPIIEDAFGEMDTLISTGFIGTLIIDSLDAMLAKKVDGTDYGNSMGGTAGALAMHLPKLFAKIVEFNVTTIIIKQCRVKMNTNSPGEVLTFSGGKALRHFADSIFILKKLSNHNLTYNPVKIKAEKTRSARMGLVLEIPLCVHGYDIVRDLVNLAIMHGVIKQSGSWMMYNDYKVQGAENLVNALREDLDTYNEIKTTVYKEIINISKVVGESIGEINLEE